MRLEEGPPRTVHRNDYRPPDYLIDEVELHFELGEDRTVVRSTLSIRRNPALPDSSPDLVLDGEQLELVSISVDGRPPANVVVDHNAVTNTNALTQIELAIFNAYQGISPLPVGSLTVTTTAIATLGRVLEIQSTEGAVVIAPAASNDLSGALMLGGASGGIEFDAYSRLRPTASGVVARLGSTTGRPRSAWLDRVFALAVLQRNQVTALSLADPGSPSSPYTGPIALGSPGASPIAHAATTPPLAAALGSMEVLRAGLDAIASGIETAIRTTRSAAAARVSRRRQFTYSARWRWTQASSKTRS